jgi:phage gpG-like protein
VIKFTGDFRKLQKWSDRLGGADDVLERAARNMADEALDLIVEGFKSATDPYGKKWAPLVLRTGRALSDTGRLRSSWHRKRVDRRGFTIAAGVAYARYHQRGTGIYGPRKRPITPKTKKALAFSVRGGGRHVVRSVRGSPARRMIPVGGRLPPRWRNRLIAAAEDVFIDHFR